MNRVPYPLNLTDQSDFTEHGELIETCFLDKSFIPTLIVGGVIPQGVAIQIGGVVYRADTDESITGTASKYVKITASGATASAAYVSNLTGVTWNKQYNGYYGGSSELYLFDENRALYDGAISAGVVRSRFVHQTVEGDVYIGRDLAVKRNLAVTGTINTGQGDNKLHPMNQPVRTTDGVSFSTVNTGHGANELYPMNQAVRTTDAVSFSTVNTGQGDNELYAMDQRVRTTDAVIFSSVNTGHGYNELYPMDQGVRTTDDVKFRDLSYDRFLLPGLSSIESVGVPIGETIAYLPKLVAFAFLGGNGAGGAHTVSLQIYRAGNWLTIKTQEIPATNNFVGDPIGMIFSNGLVDVNGSMRVVMSTTSNGTTRTSGLQGIRF